MSKLWNLTSMKTGPIRDKLQKELNISIPKACFSSKIPKKFKDEVNQSLRIKASPYPEDRGKSEAEITHEHEFYLKRNKIYFWHTKVKGEIHSIGNNTTIMKKSANPGFFDMILLIQGKIFVGLELKHGDGGIWSADQIAQHKTVVSLGGYALVSNSVKITDAYLKSKGLI
jgi:hypothetical protein